MPSNVPVPSKGALRALRNLALGTSCTIAFGIGVVTEDRRRRIHSVRTVHENAKNIKSSSRYHGSGKSPAPSFEEEVARSGHLSPLINNDLPGAVRQRWSHEPEGHEERNLESKTKYQQTSRAIPRHDPKDTRNRSTFAQVVGTTGSPVQSTTEKQQNSKNRTGTHSYRKPANHVTESSRPWTLAVAEKQTASLALEEASAAFYKARRSTNEIKRLLGDGQSSSDLDAAISKFWTCYPFDISKSKIGEDILGIVKLLIDACQRHCRTEEAQSLLETILQSTRLDERQFNDLNPAVIIENLLQDHIRIRTKTLKKYHKSDKSIRAAIHIFLTTLSEKPKIHRPEMYAVGHKLCQMAFQAESYTQAERIYWRLSNYRGEERPVCTDILILSACSKGRFSDATRYYNNFFSHETPDDGTFSKVTGTVIHGLLKGKKLDQAEEVLKTGGKIAGRNCMRLQSGWITQLLRERWRMRQKIPLSMALFERIEHLATLTERPAAMYSVIIQQCLEAEREDEARVYFQNLIEIVGPVEAKADISIRGHFALDHAKKNHWAVVANSFDMMQAQGLNQSREQEHTAAFTPILKLFAKTHNIGEIEEFVKLYLGQYGVVPDMHIANIVVGAYANAKEIDSIPQWLAYARSLKLKITAVTFNVLFHACASIWHVPFDDLHNMYRKVKSLDEDLVDERTLDILRLSAIELDKTNQYGVKAKLRELDVYGLPRHSDDSHSIFQKMLVEITYGDPMKALSIYTKAKAKGILFTANVSGLAVRAALQRWETDGYATAARIIKNAQDDGQDIGTVLAPMLSHQLSGEVAENEDVTRLLPQLIESLDKRGVNLSWRTVTRAVSTLLDQNRTREALNLWSAMSEYKEGPGKHDSDLMGIVDLSVLLKGYLVVKDTSGLRWVIQRVLTNDIAPDSRFRKALKNARSDARKEMAIAGDHHLAQTWLEALEQCYGLVIQERQRFTVEAKQAQWKTIDMVEEALLEQNNHDPTKVKQLKEAAEKEKIQYNDGPPIRWVLTHNESIEFESQGHQPSIAAAAH